ncbi:MAG: nitroreductase family protein [Paludibacter sp.]
MELLDALNWRYATKKFDSTKKVDQSLVNKIVEAARLAPTSSGLQPFELFVITNQELKNKLVSVSFDQQIVADCSHLLVFAAWDNYTAERIDQIYALTTTEREQPADRYSAYTDRLKNLYLQKPAEQNFTHAAHQAFISLGFAIAEAASLKVDATPVGGFIPAEVDKLLNLTEKGLKSVVLLPIGYRDEANDWLANLKKVRNPMDKFMTLID